MSIVLKRYQLVAGEKAKIARYETDDGLIKLRWTCPVDREVVGDKLELHVEGSHVYYFTSLASAKKVIDRVATCSGCECLRVLDDGCCDECCGVG